MLRAPRDDKLREAFVLNNYAALETMITGKSWSPWLSLQLPSEDAFC